MITFQKMLRKVLVLACPKFSTFQLSNYFQSKLAHWHTPKLAHYPVSLHQISPII